MTSWQYSYRRYLESPRWAELRDQVHGRVRRRNAGYLACEDCGCRGRGCGGFDIHHRRYPSEWGGRLGEEDPDRDLLLLCQECHRKRHPGWRRRDQDVETSPTFEELFRLLDELG